MKELKVIVKNTGEPPKEQVIEDSLEGLQKLVGGYIEVTMITPEILLILNEEGKLNGLEENFAIVTFEEKGEVFQNQVHDIICGNCFFVASNGEEFASLSEEQAYFIQSQFNLDGTIFAIDRKEVGI
jgi:hypothetical protein